MKKNSLKIVLVTTLLLMAACGKDKGNEKPYATNVLTSGCLVTKVAEDEEAWNVFWNDGNLIVAHTDWMVPCDLHDVTVSVEVDGTVVTINECGKGGEVDCVCDMHNSFTIVGLDHGTYTFVFKEGTVERHRQEYTI